MLKKELTVEEKIKHWDFCPKGFIKNNEKRIKLRGIPMSYEGEMTLDKIAAFVKKRKKVEVSPIFSGDNKAIYCFSVILALKLLSNGHTLKEDQKIRHTITFE